MVEGRVSPIRVLLIVVPAAALTILAYRAVMKDLVVEPAAPARMTMEEACAASGGHLVGLDLLRGETSEGVLYEVRLAACASEASTRLAERLVAKRSEIESLLAPGDSPTFDEIRKLYDRHDQVAERLEISSRLLELKMDFDYSRLPEAKKLELLWGRQLSE